MRLSFRPRLVLGTDIVHLPRLLWAEKPNWRRLQAFAKRILTQAEMNTFVKRHPFFNQDNKAIKVPVMSLTQMNAIREFVGGRWAAKEAAMKAWGADILSPQQLEVSQDKKGRPSIHCFVPEGTDADNITSQEGLLTLSHDADHVTAVVLAEPLHPKLQAEFVKIMSEARAKVRGSLRSKSEPSEDKREPLADERDFFPQSDPQFDNIIDVDKP
jgi:phosphopantetheine--protein transferase-like protein